MMRPTNVFRFFRTTRTLNRGNALGNHGKRLMAPRRSQPKRRQRPRDFMDEKLPNSGAEIKPKREKKPRSLPVPIKTESDYTSEDDWTDHGDAEQLTFEETGLEPPSHGPFILDTIISFNENSELEFKERKDQSLPLSIAMAKWNVGARYICAFLNTEGGSIFFGIADNGTVKGIVMNRKEMDKINLALDHIVHHHIEPYASVKPIFHNVYDGNGEPTNRRVLEVVVPKGEEALYEFQGKAWKKYNGSVFRMKLDEKKRRILDHSKRDRAALDTAVPGNEGGGSDTIGSPGIQE